MNQWKSQWKWPWVISCVHELFYYKVPSFLVLPIFTIRLKKRNWSSSPFFLIFLPWTCSDKYHIMVPSIGSQRSWLASYWLSLVSVNSNTVCPGKLLMEWQWRTHGGLDSTVVAAALITLDQSTQQQRKPSHWPDELIMTPPPPFIKPQASDLLWHWLTRLYGRGKSGSVCACTNTCLKVWLCLCICHKSYWQYKCM